jgi:hypothetical protein
MTDEECYDQMLQRPAYRIQSTTKRGRKKGKAMPHLRLSRGEILRRYEMKYGTMVVWYLRHWQPRNGYKQADIAIMMGCSTQAVSDMLKRLKAAQ